MLTDILLDYLIFLSQGLTPNTLLFCYYLFEMIGKNNIGKGESCYGSTVNGNAKEKFREDSLAYSEIIVKY